MADVDLVPLVGYMKQNRPRAVLLLVGRQLQYPSVVDGERDPQYWPAMIQKIADTKTPKWLEKLTVILNKYNADTFVVTSCVDNAFAAADWPRKKIHEVRGSVVATQCSRPCSTPPVLMPTHIDGSETTCYRCGYVSLPNIDDGSPKFNPERRVAQHQMFVEWQQRWSHNYVTVAVGVDASEKPWWPTPYGSGPELLLDILSVDVPSSGKLKRKLFFQHHR